MQYRLARNLHEAKKSRNVRVNFFWISTKEGGHEAESAPVDRDWDPRALGTAVGPFRALVVAYLSSSALVRRYSRDR